MKFEDIFIKSSTPIFSEIKSTSNLVKPNFDNFIEKVKQSYENKNFKQGKQVLDFENKLSKIHGTNECIAFCNGLWGMVLTIQALCLPHKTEVIMPTMTYRRLADITAWLNLTPHFCDIDPKGLGATVATVESCINSDTGLLLIAQPIVKVCDMHAFERLGKKYSIPVLFDSVEAGVGTLKNKKIGSFGAAECFSMHASKLINGFEAGYITTNDTQLAEKLRELRCNGLNNNNAIISNGLNTELNEVHAAMGLIGLAELGPQIERNKARYYLYKQLLKTLPSVTLVEYDEQEARGYKNILIKLEDNWPLSRQETLTLMHQDNILARPYYWPVLHTKETDYPTISGNIIHANNVSEQYILMPSGEFLSLEDIHKVVHYLKIIHYNSQEIKERL
ncbi:DegT/DnrJ/EryC1/StrS family aminotransferase [Psychromonas sp. L1A2]|uniref:DegT/DnrJ/EryC1/StrS family aminotransferase n=1 Tax=Psychromonas sp. L1A2 TaxID=2686356 RepID=UPI0013575910|nr:DegT/DnrJ/EryC1/StrS family aminotransferase [Psychromonas sp. L1A2]